VGFGRSGLEWHGKVDMIGKTLSHYKVLSELGRGGMGVVYRALDTRLGREVALKVLSPTAGRDPEQQQRLLKEARAVASLAHPAVSVVYEIDETDGATFIAMELVRGRPIEALLAETPLQPERALDLAIEVAEGLAEAHARGVVHRDLKPKNVMLTDSGHAKIIDFGLAKLLRPRPPFESGSDTPARGDTDPGRIVGTAAYMSPEQVRGAEIDARSDLFAFGALLYEMLAGEPAFRRETGVETLHAVLKESAPRLRESGLRQAAPVVQRVLDRCLAKAAEDRYASASELLADLREARRRLSSGSAIAPALPVPSPVAPRPRAASPLRVVIVDDEEPARALLREYLERAGSVEVVGECRNGFEAVKAVHELQPDLLFLDIQMPKLNGFEVLELIGRDMPVVFATAFDEHAIRAFEVNAVDYVLKPASPERVAVALERGRERVASKRPMPVAELAAAARAGSPALARIAVRQGSRVHVIPVEKLDWVEAQDDYVGLRSEGKTFLKQQTLSDLERSLDPGRFVRIHRSYLLNLDRLARIDTEGGEPKAVLLNDGTRLPLSRSGYGRLKVLL
jgi:two-component system LytT family response regulator